MSLLRPLLVLLVCGVSMALWLDNFLSSPAWDRARAKELDYQRTMLQKLTPDLAEERMLAEAYWRRYPDVRQDAFWGEHSAMGIRGPRDHFRQYGRHEGRILGPIMEAPEPEREAELAEAYWQRHPDIARDAVWGREGSLGVLGARDHYRYYGQAQGKAWGLVTNSDTIRP